MLHAHTKLLWNLDGNLEFGYGYGFFWLCCCFSICCLSVSFHHNWCENYSSFESKPKNENPKSIWVWSLEKEYIAKLPYEVFFNLQKKDVIHNLYYSLQSLLYLPFAIANALTARLNDGYVVIWLLWAE